MYDRRISYSGIGISCVLLELQNLPRPVPVFVVSFEKKNYYVTVNAVIDYISVLIFYVYICCKLRHVNHWIIKLTSFPEL